jgi:hypothetical protein
MIRQFTRLNRGKNPGSSKYPDSQYDENTRKRVHSSVTPEAQDLPVNPAKKVRPFIIRPIQPHKVL